MDFQFLLPTFILDTQQREKRAAEEAEADEEEEEEEEAEEEKDRLVKLFSEADESTNAKLTRGPRFQRPATRFLWPCIGVSRRLSVRINQKSLFQRLHCPFHRTNCAIPSLAAF